jgi:hypothetical protein
MAPGGGGHCRPDLGQQLFGPERPLLQHRLDGAAEIVYLVTLMLLQR